jgi:Flp pilus assembly protein TadD
VAARKIYQRLGQHDDAWLWFARAFEVNSTQPDVAREAGLAALETSRYRDGACLFLVAIQSSPGDGGLRANLALAYLLDSRLEDALREAELAVEQDPSDSVSANVLRLVRDVQAGRRPQPSNAADLR